MTEPTLAGLLAGGGKYAKWEHIGQIVRGRITHVHLRQETEFGSSTLATWDDGSPKMQVVIEVQTDVRDDADDDGRRNLVINIWGAQKRALVEACRKADVGEPRVGDMFEAKWMLGAGGARDPRQYQYVIQPGDGLAAALDTTPAPAPAPAPAPEVAADPLAGLSPEVRAALANLLPKQ